MASSSAPKESGRILLDRHEILQFDTESDKRMFRSLRNKRILPTYHLKPSRMHSMKHWLESMVPIQWRKVFEIDCIPYRELVLEFFSTFHIFPDNADLDYQSIVFRLGGDMRKISLREFALRLGIYTAEDQGLLGSGHQITELTRFNFWKEIIGHERSFKVSYIKEASHRVLYQIMTAALFGHQEIVGDQNHSDIRLLHSFIKKSYLCPAKYIADACVNKFPGKWDEKNIGGGKFVTKLAESFGILTSDFTSTLEPVERAFMLEVRNERRLTRLSEPDFKSWAIVFDASPTNSPPQKILRGETSVLNPTPVSNPLVLPGPSEPPVFNLGELQFHPGTSTPIMETESFHDLFKDIPLPEDILEYPTDLIVISDSPLQEMHSQASFGDLFREISQDQTFYFGESSQPAAPPVETEIPIPEPVVEEPATLESIARNVKKVEKDLEKLQTAVAELTMWLKVRLNDP